MYSISGCEVLVAYMNLIKIFEYTFHVDIFFSLLCRTKNEEMICDEVAGNLYLETINRTIRETQYILTYIQTTSKCNIADIAP